MCGHIDFLITKRKRMVKMCVQHSIHIKRTGNTLFYVLQIFVIASIQTGILGIHTILIEV